MYFDKFDKSFISKIIRVNPNDKKYELIAFNDTGLKILIDIDNKVLSLLNNCNIESNHNLFEYHNMMYQAINNYYVVSIPRCNKSNVDLSLKYLKALYKNDSSAINFTWIQHILNYTVASLLPTVYLAGEKVNKIIQDLYFSKIIDYSQVKELVDYSLKCIYGSLFSQHNLNQSTKKEVNYIFAYLTYQFWNKKINENVSDLKVLEFSILSNQNFCKLANSNNSLRSIDSLFETENTSIQQIMSLEYFYEFLENKEE